MTEDLFHIIDPERGGRGYTTLGDIEHASSRGLTQVRLRVASGKTYSEHRDTLRPGLRAAFDRLHPSQTIHVDNLKHASLVHASMRFKIQISSAEGWGDAKKLNPDGTYTLLAFATKREAKKAMTEGFDDGDARVVPIGNGAEVDLYSYSQAVARGEEPPKPRPKFRI